MDELYNEYLTIIQDLEKLPINDQITILNKLFNTPIHIQDPVEDISINITNKDLLDKVEAFNKVKKFYKSYKKIKDQKYYIDPTLTIPLHPDNKIIPNKYNINKNLPKIYPFVTKNVDNKDIIDREQLLSLAYHETLGSIDIYKKNTQELLDILSNTKPSIQWIEECDNLIRSGNIKTTIFKNPIITLHKYTTNHGSKIVNHFLRTKTLFIVNDKYTTTPYNYILNVFDLTYYPYESQTIIYNKNTSQLNNNILKLIDNVNLVKTIESIESLFTHLMVNFINDIQNIIFNLPKLDKDIIVYRATDKIYSKTNENNIYQTKSFMSTTLSFDLMYAETFNVSYIERITIFKGFNCVYLEPYTNNNHEQEILLPFNTQLYKINNTSPFNILHYQLNKIEATTNIIHMSVIKQPMSFL